MFVCVGVFLCLGRRQDHSGGIFEGEGMVLVLEEDRCCGDVV